MSWFRRRRETAGTGAQRWPQLQEKDRKLLYQLEAHGADLREPRHVLHFLYFTDGRADAAADEAAAQGWQVQVREPDAEIAEWSLVCERPDVVLDGEVVGRTSTWFEELAARHGGTYDGWEAAV